MNSGIKFWIQALRRLEKRINLDVTRIIPLNQQTEFIEKIRLEVLRKQKNYNPASQECHHSKWPL